MTNLVTTSRANSRYIQVGPSNSELQLTWASLRSAHAAELCYVVRTVTGVQMKAQAPPYSIARAELIAGQIGRFATQHLHQLAGHHANLEFWLAEAVSALRAIDGYQARFKQIRDAQVSWVREHETRITQFCPVCQGACEFGPQTPERPSRVPTEDLDAARTSVRVAVRQFVVRLHHSGFLSEADARQAADLVGASIEQEDLER